MHLDGWTLVLQTINFAILVWLLHRFLYKPVLRMIDTRQAQIAQQYADATAAAQKAKAQLETTAAERAGMVAERAAELKAAAADGQKLIEMARAQAERDTQALVESTRKAMAAERQCALEEARRMALDLGAEFAGRLLAEMPMALRAEDWIERIERHLGDLPPTQRDALRRQLADGSVLTVVTAAPLPESAAEPWREQLRRHLGEHVNIAFEVSPALIGGAELHFPMAVLRFSWQAALEAARAELAHANTR